ncbi:MAG: hypothetical protein JHD16_16245 [Solirubrobacteraceae bacterium]|nr:hypothetical protein [Solirubrobacteraceae bacterium]
MNVSAINSSMAGIAQAQAQHAGAATAIATGGDMVSGIVNAGTAEVQMAVSTSMLKQAMDQDKYLIDVLVK